jgi:predicted SAM-dependent methyltransferase
MIDRLCAKRQAPTRIRAKNAWNRSTLGYVAAQCQNNLISMSSPQIRLNLGCGGRPLEGYVNIDKDTLDKIKIRYPDYSFPEDVTVNQYDIFNLPYEDQSISEVRAESLLEHLSFVEEKKIFLEVKRVLQPGGIFQFSVPDFEATVRQWLDAEDDWREFYRNDDEAILQKHWFGQYSDSVDNRWGYLTAIIFGPQNSEGQFHKNCYTEEKIKSVLVSLGFSLPEITRGSWKNNDAVCMLNVIAMLKN